MNNLTKESPNQELIFTRFLYAKDEVFLSMVSSMLSHNLEETLFWFSEWITSVKIHDATQEIWKIYYDFYSICNPRTEKYIQSKIKMISDGEKPEIAIDQDKIKIFANIIKNFVISENSSDVFMLRQFIKNEPSPSKIYKGRKPKWLNDFDKEYKNLLLSLNRRNWYNVGFYFSLLHKNTSEKLGDTETTDIIDDIHNVIITYFKTVEKISFNMDFVFKKWREITYDNKNHLLLAIIIYLTKPSEEIDYEKKMFVSITQNEEELLKINQADKPYDLLKRNRIYRVNQNIGCFRLSRNNLTKEYNEIWYHHWEYFAYRSYYWREKFGKYNCEFNHETLKIMFPNDVSDNNYEDFYENYGYEPDEQSTEVQQQSLCEIPEIPYQIWLENCFPDTMPIIELQEKTESSNFVFVW